jgi:mRNA (2'-O-methyladenosine-N6-)-methyltransferase
MDLKAQHVDHHSHPPLHLPLSSTSSPDITSALGSNRFDVILLRPLGTWQETAELPIRSISADPGFVFLWVGKGDEEGLERGRECFAKWGFRRAEDIVWVKTNRLRTLHGDSKDGSEADGSGGGGLFASSKEHCLMGIRGTVRRSTDSRFVHCNVDTDIIVHEPTLQSSKLPPILKP